MQKEQITDKEAICLLIVFMMGTTLILGGGGEAKNDAWISIIVCLFMFIPMLFVFSRILSIYEGKDLFDILTLLFGKVIGRFLSVIYIWYAFHLGALALRNFGEFINTVAMPETPIFVSLLFMGLVCIIAVKHGIEVIGRTTTYFLPIMFFTLFIVQILSLPQLHFNYLKPILGKGMIPIIKGAFSAFSFPFAETVLFIGVFSALKSKKSHIKVYLWGILISFTIIMIVTIRNITILGNMLGNFYFPSYEAVSQIHIGDFIQRIEVTVSIVFVFGVLMKSSVCLFVACKGIEKIFKLHDYRSIVIQTGLLMIYFSYILYDNIMEMQYWAFKVYPYYAFPMQVIIPTLIWIFAEIKVRKSKNSTVQDQCCP